MACVYVALDGTFEGWRDVAKALLLRRVSPELLFFQDPRDEQPGLFGKPSVDLESAPLHADLEFVVPRGFVQRAKMASWHRDPKRWGVMYRLLWKMLILGQREVWGAPHDLDATRLRRMAKEVSRDAHKMKAFVRFRKVQQSPEMYEAYYEPDHPILRLVTPFFADRFGPMRWRIITPDETASWDTDLLCYGPGEHQPLSNSDDDLSQLWRTYWGSIYNPARLNLRAMRSEMPQKFWKHLPEIQILDHVVRQTPQRVQAMIDQAPGSAKSWVPKDPPDLETLASAARSCRACPLGSCPGVQSVFGQGPINARLVIVGEQPGDAEDALGLPFVGPAGRVLDRALSCSGIRRDAVYLTNVVKHFRHHTEPDGKRTHRTPTTHHVQGCRPWLEAELKLIKPDVIVCLGKTSAQALLGRRVVLKHERGKLHHSLWATKGVVTTYHPAAALRAWDRRRQLDLEGMIAADLGFAAGLLVSS